MGCFGREAPMKRETLILIMEIVGGLITVASIVVIMLGMMLLP